MKQVENSLSVKEKAKETPGFGVVELVIVLLIYFTAKKEK